MYAKILRTIVRDFYNKNKFTIRKISLIFNISKSTIGRWIKNDYKLRKQKYDNNILSKFIKKLLLNDPFITIQKIKTSIFNKYKYNVSLSYIFKYIKMLNFTRKKVSRKFHGGKLEKLYKQQKSFKNKLKKISNKKIICIDESGFMSNDYQHYGRSPKGTRLYVQSKANPIKYNLIMAIIPNGILAYEIHKKNIDKHLFLSFIKNKVLPYAKNKHILMDNIRFHKSKEVQKEITDNNTKSLFIPPYSPQFNSIEYVFNIIKTKYRQQLNNGINCNTLIESIINSMKNSNFNNIYKFVKSI